MSIGASKKSAKSPCELYVVEHSTRRRRCVDGGGKRRFFVEPFGGGSAVLVEPSIFGLPELTSG